MQCPLCRDTQLQPRFAQGVEVDVCPRCRGLWLDRGELERLLHDDAPAATPHAPPPHPVGERPYEPPRRRKKSTAKRLADLFEDVLDL